MQQEAAELPSAAEPLGSTGALAAADLTPASKRPRTNTGPAATALHEVLVPHVLAAFPVAGAAAADPALLGARVSGRVEAVCGDTTLFITLSIAGLPAEFKGALFCPPPGLLSPTDGGTMAASAPAPPLKRPRTAFNFFSDAVRPAAKQQNPQADQQTVSKIVGEMWAQLPGTQREPYHEQARRDRERYEREVREQLARQARPQAQTQTQAQAQPQATHRDPPAEPNKPSAPAPLPKHATPKQPPRSTLTPSVPLAALHAAPGPPLVASFPAQDGPAAGLAPGSFPATLTVSGQAPSSADCSSGSLLGLAQLESFGQQAAEAALHGSTKEMPSMPRGGGSLHDSLSLAPPQQSISFPAAQHSMPGIRGSHAGDDSPAAAALSALLLHRLQAGKRLAQGPPPSMPPPAPPMHSYRRFEQAGSGAPVSQLMASLMGQPAPATHAVAPVSAAASPGHLALVCAQLMQQLQQP